MEGERTLRLSVSSNKLGVEKADVVTVNIRIRMISLYTTWYMYLSRNATWRSAFSKLLDSAQDMRGLAFYRRKYLETVNVDGNKLRLYPDADLREKGCDEHPSEPRHPQ